MREMSQKSRRQKVADVDIVQKFKGSKDPVLTAAELAEQLPISRQQLNYRLGDLEDREVLASKQCGSGRAWWLKR